jgi:hypothetical protein
MPLLEAKSSNDHKDDIFILRLVKICHADSGNQRMKHVDSRLEQEKKP